MFTADVAVNDHPETAQNSSCILAQSQETVCRVVDFGAALQLQQSVGVELSKKRRKVGYVSCGATC